MRIPGSTYRIQFNSGFRFADAQEIVGYLADLGITDLYASPVFKAREGSVHGYDMVDPTVLNPEIGSMEDFQQLVHQLRRAGTGWLQDIVPNHMAFDAGNDMLMDVLENGSASDHYRDFDIEWDHAYESLRGRLLAPFLGKSYARALEDGEIKIEYNEAGFGVLYFELRFPLRIESYPRILLPGLEKLKHRLGMDHNDFIKLAGTLYTLKAFPCQELAGERYDQIRFAKRLLWELYSENDEIRDYFVETLRNLNGEGDTRDLTSLDALLAAQFYRLSYWKVASEELNYRRFFTINELISLRMEDAEVFQRCHTLIMEFIRRGLITGLRVDHIDGLYDPLNYLQQLKEATGGAFVVVEKILAMNEDLPEQWPVQGTTGYDFLNYLNGIFCKKENMRQFDGVYAAFLGHGVDYEDLVRRKKAIIIDRFMTGDVDNLAHLLKRISSKDRGGDDITLYGLKRAIYELLTCFPVYRTYVNRNSYTDVDRKYIVESFERARQRNPDLIQELEYLRKFLLLEYDHYLTEANDRESWLHFLMRFQQFSGPLMAKGFEDTTLYVYNRLLSLNDVGGEPSSFGTDLDEFHAFNARRASLWPHTLNASSTHDTKRGEDARARINVLSEIPAEWQKHLARWRESNNAKKKTVGSLRVPVSNDEYFLYQTLLGSFPVEHGKQVDSSFVARVKEYIVKATREAKVHTGWIMRDEDYENAYREFVEAILDPSGENGFLDDFLPFLQKIAHHGILNSLSQVIVKIASPGIPDFYQGTELWELSMVDPDNRRPVDYTVRKEYLDQIRGNEGNPAFPAELLAHAGKGVIKMYFMHKALQARKRHAEVFQSGSYIPVQAEGTFRDHIAAFAREHDGMWIVAAVPRFTVSLVQQNEYPLGEGVWLDTALIFPDGSPDRWKNVLTGESVVSKKRFLAGRLFDRLPGALLAGE